MNQHDKQNLDFLRNLCEEELEKWYKKSSEDEINYASELLMQWETELELEALELLDDVESTDIADTVLNKIFRK